jgi:hypothetical protein
VATNTARDVKELARQMARTDDRRAASQFHYRQEIRVLPLKPEGMLARFAKDVFRDRGEPSLARNPAARDPIAEHDKAVREGERAAAQPIIQDNHPARKEPTIYDRHPGLILDDDDRQRTRSR